VPCLKQAEHPVRLQRRAPLAKELVVDAVRIGPWPSFLSGAQFPCESKYASVPAPRVAGADEPRMLKLTVTQGIKGGNASGKYLPQEGGAPAQIHERV
ncbi:MAG TPA: hypothetical protein VFK86_07560, partial [Bauldia sp.]|nr:hypothetical protein [Bauldia sp.]